MSLAHSQTEVAASPAPELDPRARRRSFWVNRLASLLALAPLGVWTVIHLWNNLAALEGPEAWQKAVTGHATSFGIVLVSLIVLVPLVWHAAWGVDRVFAEKPNYPRYSYFWNLRFVLQRISALGVLAFLVAHLWLAFLEPRLVEHRPEPFADIAHEMHFHGPTLVVYVLGVLGVTYHLANGAQTFLMSWGLVSTRRALKKWTAPTFALFAVLLAMGWGSIYALWSAGAKVQVDENGKPIPTEPAAPTAP